MPEKVVPEEMKAGYGDGLVSAASSVLPYSDKHYDFHFNHVALLFEREVRSLVISEVQIIAAAS